MLRSADRAIHVHRLLSRAMPVTTAQARYQREVMRDTPRAFWPLQDSSGNPVDASGNGLNMTSVTGTPDYRQEGPFGDDFSIFTGNSEAINRSTEVSTVQNNFTMELWLKVTQVNATDQMVMHNGGTTSGGTAGWGIRMDTGDRYCGLAGGISELLVRGIGLFTWTHLVVQRDGSDSNRWKYYQNGNLTVGNAGTTNPNVPSGVLILGGSASYAAYYAYVAVYETALSAARILAHFNAAGIRGNP